MKGDFLIHAPDLLLLNFVLYQEIHFFHFFTYFYISTEQVLDIHLYSFLVVLYLLVWLLSLLLYWNYYVFIL